MPLRGCVGRTVWNGAVGASRYARLSRNDVALGSKAPTRSAKMSKVPSGAFDILALERVLCGQCSSTVPPSFPVMKEARSLETIVAGTGRHFGLMHTYFLPFQARRRSDRISCPLTC